jgi:50S ribosomal protein L16 3-hydroxylase
MLSEWLKPVPVEAFVRKQVGKTPFAMAGSALGTTGTFGWETLGRVLAAEPAADVLVVALGKLIDLPAPRTLEDARALLSKGIGLVIRRAEQHDPGLGALASAFARDLNGEAHIQLFITPAGTHGFDWHYDFEEVFIAQTLGIKEYFFRDNTADRTTPVGTNPDFGLIRKETTPIATAKLCAGDWVYIPSRWWHVASCVEESLSISVGVLRDGARESVR